MPSPHDPPTDPRLLAKLEADIVAVGQGEGEALLNLTDAVLLEGIESCLVGAKTGEEPAELMMAVQMFGRINQTDQHISPLFLTDLEGLAQLVGGVVEQVASLGPETLNWFLERLAEHIK